MEDHSECKRQFYHLSRAWHSKAILEGADFVDQIMIGFYHPEGGTTGEFGIRWTHLGGKVVPRLEAFDDSWSALWEFKDLLEKLSELDATNPTPTEICKFLISLGIEDATRTEE